MCERDFLITTLLAYATKATNSHSSSNTFFPIPMRYSYFCALAALLIFSISACQKSSVTPTLADQAIIGEWRWASSAGGLTGKQTYTPASTGSTDTWVFSADSTYQRHTTSSRSAQLTETGTFSLGSIKSIYSGQPARALILRGKQSQTFITQEVTARLVLADNHYDGFKHTYER
jgi:hypothetical protein